MIKKILCTAVLAACAAAAQAETATQWRFTWTGFNIENDRGTADFDPSYSVTGTFSAIDTDRDNVIRGSELTELTVLGRNFLDCMESPGANCGTTWFTYSKNAGLSFMAFYEEMNFSPWGDAIPKSQLLIETANNIGYSDYSDSKNNYAHWFTSETVQTITQVGAVPEPQTYAMFGAGMLLLGAAARRRNRR